MHQLDCDETAERLNLYLDRELSDADVVQVREHLSECPPCERIFDFQAEVKRLVRSPAAALSRSPVARRRP